MNPLNDDSLIKGFELFPTREEFAREAGGHSVVPVWVELVADAETPLSLLSKLGEEEPSFLLESAEQNDLVGRHSFVGSGARAVLTCRNGIMTHDRRNGETTSWEASDPLRELEAVMSSYRSAPRAELPGFTGGAVGYLGYEAVTAFEPSVPRAGKDDLNVPDMLFLIADTVIQFDHRARKIKIVASAFAGELGVWESRREAAGRISAVLARLNGPSRLAPFPSSATPLSQDVVSNMSREEYEGAVIASKEYIRSGDIFQIVLSQRFSIPFSGDPLHLYRALRHVNPSPYMFCLRLPGGLALVGSSPEVHVKVTDGNVQIRPIAGTRRRGSSPGEDEALSSELLADPKERAEHLMLVDLARNDVGRISEFGSVQLTDFMTIERYSHVMHIVSNVVGRLSGDHTPLDVLRATFPAGTVSGSPKVRAMQLIASMEPTTRGAYAGAVGYLGFDGRLDSCIALRTVLLKDGLAHVQAGAGVVADSRPEAEYEETVNKAMGVVRAVGLASATLPTSPMNP
jgi:anthranilate synthase component 1